MTTESNLTMKQGRYIYGFIRRNAQNSEEMIEHYVSMEKAKSITKQTGIVVIGNLKSYEKGLTTKETAEKILIEMGMPENFRLTGDSQEQPAEHPSFKDFAEEETTKQPTESDLEEMLKTLESIVNKETIDKLKSLIDSDRQAANNAIQKLMHDLEEKEIDHKKAVEALEAEIERIKALPPKLPELKPMNGDYVKHEMFDKVAAYVNAGANVLLTGPAGTGKSMMGREIAKAQGKEYFEQSLGGGMRYAQIIGAPVLKDGNSDFRLSAMVEAMQNENCIVVLNEIFGLESEVLLAFNDAFEKNTRHIRTPKGKIEIKAKVIATANTTGRSVSRQYTGAQRADDSLISRFTAKVHIKVDPKVEEKILEQVENDTHRADIRTRLADLRKGIAESNIPFDAGTRELTNCIELYGAIGDVETAFEDSFLGGLSRAEKRKLNLL